MLNNMITRKFITDAKKLKVPFILSPVQIKILYYLYQHPDEFIYQKDIEKLIEARRSTTSGILDTMEKNNLIMRINSDKDARTKRIILTDYSNNLAKIMMRQKIRFDKDVENSIEPEELEIFYKVMNKIKNNIINMK